LRFGIATTIHHIKNAEITPELHDDLISFSFDKLQDVFKNNYTLIPDRRGDTLITFIPHLLVDLKRLVCYRFYPCMKF